MNNNHGGKRAGSGRKTVIDKKIPVSYKLPEYIIEFLREHKRTTGQSAAQTIEDCINHYYGK